MTPNHDHSVRRCETSKPPVEKSRERARVARVSFLQALDDHSMWHAGRIGFADFIADGAVMLADGVQLHPGICSLVGALLRHLFEVLDAGIAEIVVARNVSNKRPRLPRQRRCIPCRRGHVFRRDPTHHLYRGHFALSGYETERKYRLYDFIYSINRRV